MFFAMSSMVKVNYPIDENIENGEDFYQNNSQIMTEMYMPYVQSERYNPSVSFLDNYTVPFDGYFICMCCGSRGFKPKLNLGEYQEVFNEVTPMKREEIASLFNTI